MRQRRRPSGRAPPPGRAPDPDVVRGGLVVRHRCWLIGDVGAVAQPARRCQDGHGHELTLTLPKRLKPRTWMTAPDSFAEASPTAIFLLPNNVNPPTSTRTPSGTSTSMFPNGAMARIATSL